MTFGPIFNSSINMSFYNRLFLFKIVSMLSYFDIGTIQTLIVGLQQELRTIASLRYSSVYPITDTTNEYKCVLQLLWQTSGQQEMYLGREAWKRLCERYVRTVGMTCKWMVDIHPDFYKDRFLVYK